MPAHSKHLVFLWVGTQVASSNDQAAQYDGFSLSMLPALLWNHKWPIKRSYFSPLEYGLAPKQARPDIGKPESNDKQKIQEREEIKIGAGQRE